MKLSPLLSDFLVSNKQLDLAGIGRFTIDDSGTISFEQNSSVREDAALVNYIVDKSGKMKSLVSADLDSHLELARQFLNIGKPYLFEGIGTLSKNKFGKFEFIQNNTSSEKKETGGERRDATSTTENSFTDYEEMFSPKKPKGSASRRIVSGIIILAGLSLAVFGGYLVYNKTKKKQDNPEPITKKAEPTIIPEVKKADIPSKDLTQSTKDTIKNVQAVTTVANTNMYRFVIERALKTRALYRYDFLKKNLIDVKMDTKDSVLFKLYFLLPSLPSDTARKRDSLQRLYSTRGRTIIELN